MLTPVYPRSFPFTNVTSFYPRFTPFTDVYASLYTFNPVYPNLSTFHRVYSRLAQVFFLMQVYKSFSSCRLLFLTQQHAQNTRILYAST